MTTPRIVADENIPYVVEAFSTIGEVATVNGRTLTREMLAEADLLMVRSVTKVNAGLLEGTPVRFVATATIGLDHLDLDYLAAKGIPHASAPGSNANSVGEYVTCALLVLAKRRGLTLDGMTAGVVGVGNVGTQVVKKLEALGMTVLKNDPPLARKTGDPSYLPLDALFDADVITVHVPLTQDGEDPTYHMIDAGFLPKLKPGAILINSSRGSVADTQALLRYLDRRGRGPVVLDVWEGEPEISADLLAKVDLGSPHIAGYSFDGKVKGCQMIYKAACDFLGVDATWDPAEQLPAPEHPAVDVSRVGGGDEDMLREACLTVYDIEADDARLRKVLGMPEGERGPYFDRLRKEYPRRREFPNTRVAGASAAAAAKLAALGFGA